MARIDRADDYILCDLPQGAGRCRGRIGRVVIVDDKRRGEEEMAFNADPPVLAGAFQAVTTLIP